ncbi:hypothetical protein RJ639_046668 [Escallonia herrerae]|uniref:Thaumatin-like protein 1 n=1 Tax=Escallonia herrerae TaxID=1293975 RepID=A0AA89AZF3_9ASTE|nr:hypothetical protein RJ639_046668 [Escallonia herrerae]
MADVILSAAILLNFLLCFPAGGYSAKLQLTNECNNTVWPALVSAGSTPTLSTPALALQPGKSTTISLPASWSGSLWARTFCTLSSTDRFACVTGDCGSGSPECLSASALPPVTMAKFELNVEGGLNSYVVSASRGYNLAILVVPHGGSGGGCMATGCVNDVEGGCQPEPSGTCNRTCFGYGEPKNCCSGGYAPPDTCKPSPYSQYFVNKCPLAYSYALNDDGKTSEKSSTKDGSRPSRMNSKRVAVIVLLVLTTVIAFILCTVLKPALVVAILSAVYTALGLLFAFL